MFFLFGGSLMITLETALSFSFNLFGGCYHFRTSVFDFSPPFLGGLYLNGKPSIILPYANPSMLPTTPTLLVQLSDKSFLLIIVVVVCRSWTDDLMVSTDTIWIKHIMSLPLLLWWDLCIVVFFIVALLLAMLAEVVDSPDVFLQISSLTHAITYASLAFMSRNIVTSFHRWRLAVFFTCKLIQ